MLGLASLSMLNSVLLRRARDAIVITYVEGLAYVVLSGGSWLLLLIPGAMAGPLFGGWLGSVTAQDLVEWFNAGNIVSIMAEIQVDLAKGGRLDLLVPQLLRNYAIFMGLFSVVCLSWAILRLRSRALKEASDVPRSRRGFTVATSRPRVGTWPMIWKELFVERGLRFHWLARILVALLIIASFVPVGFIVVNYVQDQMEVSPYGRSWWANPWQVLVEQMNGWVRIVGAGVSSLMLIAVAVRAAGSISGERDKQTLSDLLTTPLDSDAILFAKWLGSVLSVRWAWVWLGLVWLAAGFATALHPVAVPIMVGAWFAYAAFLACLGLWFSMVCRTTLRAIVWTLVSGMTFFVGHWLIWLLFMPLFYYDMGDRLQWVAKFQVGLTPPLAMSVSFPIFFFEADNHEFTVGSSWVHFLIFGLIGVAIWAFAAAVLWGIISARFRAMTNRALYARSPIVAPPHRPRRRSEVRSRNGAAALPVANTAPTEVVEALPALDEETIQEVLRVEEPPRENPG
jgi:ABC-type transport system involved in multi-copper enzyme maturation permease subunit